VAAFQIKRGASWQGRGPSGKLHLFRNASDIVTIHEEQDIEWFRSNCGKDGRFKELKTSSGDATPEENEHTPLSYDRFDRPAASQPQPEPETEEVEVEGEDEEEEAEFEVGGNGRLICPYCKNDFKNRAGILSHIRQKHPNEYMNDFEDEIEEV